MARSKPTALQRRVAEAYTELKDVTAVADRLGLSKSKVKKALQAWISTPAAERRPSNSALTRVPVERDPYDQENVEFNFSGDATVKEAWRDETVVDGKPVRNLWLRSNDGELVVVPESVIARLP